VKARETIQGERTIDPITFEVLRNAIDSVLDEMALTIIRSARSTIVRDAMDFATSFFDAEGQLLAQGLTLPFHLGGMPDALMAVRSLFGKELSPGDVFILNDPFEGGSHLPDIFMFRPIFVGDRLAGYTASTAHHTDVGGRVPGSNASDSTEIYQEGLRIPPMRLYKAGQPVGEIFRLIEANVRVPEKVLGDLQAQWNASQIGERRLAELVDHYSLATLLTYFREALDYSERVTRAEIRDLPQGVYKFTDYLDDDGIDPGPIPIKVTLTIRDDELLVDLTGTSKQVRGAINATESFTKSAVYVATRSIMTSPVPNNAGFFRPIRVIAPPGTIVNAVRPAACAARAITGFRVIDALFGALAQAAGDRVFAAGEGGNTFITLAGDGFAGKPYILVEPLIGAWGGRPHLDGVDGISPLATNIRNAPIEAIEAEYPVRVERYCFVPDSGGPGRFRGGLAIARDYRLLGPDALLQVRADRQKHLPYGLFDGKPGKPSKSTIISKGRKRTMPGKFIATLRTDSTFCHVLPSAGGYGDPLDRDPDRVLRDVLAGKVSRRGARADYGVVVKGDRRSPRVDRAATVVLRAKLRSSRAADGLL
jgi:N-methylhydantoinase B